MNKQFPLFLFAIVVVLSCNRCKEECDDATNPECPNYVAPVDPCAGHTEVTADFIMEEKIMQMFGGPIYRVTEGLSCIANEFNPYSHTLRLSVTQEYENYKWLIGSDTIENQTYEFYFPASYIGQTIPITLIVYDYIDFPCFPADDGRDTLTKYITIVSFQDNPIYGEYKIAWDSAPLDSFVVKISTPEVLINEIFLHNFTQMETQDSCNMDIIGEGYKYVHLATNLIGCQHMEGEFWINQDNSFEGQYSFDPVPPTTSLSELIPQHAKGRRIN